MNRADFLTLAKKLLLETTEAAWRSAASRAYYAAFHAAHDLLTALGFGVPQADRAHGYLFNCLQNCGNSKIQKAGADLKSMRRYRNQADYDLQLNFSKSKAVLTVDTADFFLQTLSAANQKPTRSEITDGIKVYERDVLKQVTWRKP